MEYNQVSQRVTCNLCNKTYKTKYLRSHMKTVHAVQGENVKNNMECLNCNMKFFNRKQLINHLALRHNIEMENVSLTFNSYNDFETWLEEEEKLTCSKYIRPWGEKITTNGSVITLICCRDKQVRGCSQDLINRQRVLKSQGSRKTNSVCTSYLVVNKLLLPEVKVCVQYFKTHYGHEKEVKHLQLSKRHKDMIAHLLIQGVSEPNMMRSMTEEANEAIGSRLDTLSKKDIANIRAAYGIGLSGGRTDIKNIVDDLWVTEENSIKYNEYGDHDYLFQCVSNEKKETVNLRLPKKLKTIFRANKEETEETSKEKYEQQINDEKKSVVEEFQHVFTEIGCKLIHFKHLPLDKQKQALQILKMVYLMVNPKLSSVQSPFKGVTKERIKIIQTNSKAKENKNVKINKTRPDALFPDQVELTKHEPPWNVVDHEEVVDY